MATSPPHPQGISELMLSVEKLPAEAIVHCTGKITSYSSAKLVETVRPLMTETARVILDLTHVDYMDSSGMGAVVRLWVSAKKASIEFRVVNLSPRLKDLFTLTNISSLFEGQENFGL